MIAVIKGDPDAFKLRERMANVIVEILKEKGADFVPADLLDKGFTYNEIEQNWKMALALAKVELDWMDS